jgi:DNA segregation ATPase FtsK/SpoIIIE, S-DNA-T family
MKSWVPPGEQVEKAQRGSFGRPEWRPPVYETPLTVILAVQLARLLGWVVRAWYGVMRVTGLTVSYQGREVMPELVTVGATHFVDQVVVRLVRGQSPTDVADASDGLAHGLRVHSCRVRVSRPGFVLLELMRRDTLAKVIPALPVPAEVELRALPVGRKEDGSLWTLCLRGTHVLVVGATGAGKNSVLWSMVRALLPAIRDGLVRVLGADPKRMELA